VVVVVVVVVAGRLCQLIRPLWQLMVGRLLLRGLLGGGGGLRVWAKSEICCYRCCVTVSTQSHVWCSSSTVNTQSHVWCSSTVNTHSHV